MRGSEDAASSVSARVCCPGNERWLEKKADKTRWQQGGFLVETGEKKQEQEKMQTDGGGEDVGV